MIAVFAIKSFAQRDRIDNVFFFTPTWDLRCLFNEFENIRNIHTVLETKYLPAGHVTRVVFVDCRPARLMIVFIILKINSERSICAHMLTQRNFCVFRGVGGLLVLCRRRREETRTRKSKSILSLAAFSHGAIRLFLMVDILSTPWGFNHISRSIETRRKP